jgi:GTPase SAR1 family protein
LVCGLPGSGKTTVSKQLAAGGYPRLTSTGTPTVTLNNFHVVVQNGKPNVLGALFKSSTTGTTPFAGSLFYLGHPYARVTNFTLEDHIGAAIHQRLE